MPTKSDEWPPDDRRWRFVWREDDIVWLTGPLADAEGKARTSDACNDDDLERESGD